MELRLKILHGVKILYQQLEYILSCIQIFISGMKGGKINTSENTSYIQEEKKYMYNIVFIKTFENLYSNLKKKIKSEEK